MAATPISNRTKIAMSRATPASLRRLRLVLPAFTWIRYPSSLVGIEPAAAPLQLYKTRLASSGIRQRSSHDQRNDDIANVRWRVIRARRERDARYGRGRGKLRGGRMVAGVLENGDGAAARKGIGI